MKAYKVNIVATKTMVVTEDMWVSEGGCAKDFNEHSACQLAKAVLIEDLTNDPNRGSSLVWPIYIEAKED